MLENEHSSAITYHLDQNVRRFVSKYSGKIYILDQQTGEEKEEIIVKDYMCRNVLKRFE